MARGRKTVVPLEEQLEKITNKIETTEESLKKMKLEKKRLEEEIKQTRLVELDELIRSKGLTFDEVVKMINGKNNKE